MKTLLTFILIVGSLLFYGAEQLNATDIGPFCLSFEGYCDRKEVSLNESGIIYSLWDWTCTGDPLAPGLGTYYHPYFTISTYVLGNIHIDRLNLKTKTLELWIYDGINPPYLYGNIAWTAVPGPCGFSTSDCGDNPSLWDTIH